MSQTPSNACRPIDGCAAGVPFVALAPASGPRASAPLVVAWHLLDAPRTEAAFAAALPLDGLEAWRVYFGLPMSGSRMPAGGFDELIRLGYEDAVLELDEPIVYGAAAELGPALADVRGQLGFEPGRRLGLMGGSLGAAVAQLVMAEGELEVDAAVLVSPVVQLRRAVEAGERQYGFTYEWSAAADAVAERLDFVARAPELTRPNRPAVLGVVGDQDDPGITEPAAALTDALAKSYAPEERAELATVHGMGHALAEEPGIDPAPQTPHAREVDRRAVEWFRRYLTDRS